MLVFNNDDHLITHKNCMDGAGCAIVWQLFGGNPENITFCPPNHDRVDPVAIANRKAHGGHLYLADISISELAARKLDGNNITIIDHHKSALPLKKYDWCHIDMNACGSLLFFNYVQNQQKQHVSRNFMQNYYNLFTYIDDRDRWIKAYDQSQWLSDLFNVMGQAAFIKRFLERSSPNLSSEEVFAVEMERAKKQLYIDDLKPKIAEVEGQRVGFVNCEYRYIADAGNQICERDSLDMCVLVTPDAVSLRSLKSSSLDMSVIAKIFKGGGHAQAAGFPMHQLLGTTLIDAVIKNIKINDSSESNSG